MASGRGVGCDSRGSKRSHTGAGKCTTVTTSRHESQGRAHTLPCAGTTFTRCRGSWSGVRSMNFLRSVSTYSNTRYNRWFSNTTSDSLEGGQYTACERCNPCHAHNTATHPTMFGWLSSFSSEISRMAVLGTPSSSTSNRIFLRAMIRRDRMSRALYTTPYVPSPTFSSFSYLHRGPKTRVSHLHHQHATQQPRTEIERPCRTAGRLLHVLWARRLPGPPQPPPQQHQQHQRQQAGAL